MHRLTRPVLAAVLMAGGLTTASVAEANVEIGGTAGVHVFSKTNELGVPDVANAPSERNSALFGLRLGLMFGNVIGVEGEVGAIPSESRSEVFDIWNLTYRGHLILQFGAGNPERKFIPFILGGGGGMQVVSTKRPEVIAKDTDAMGYAGIGFKYRVPHGWGLRVDGRILFPPSSTGDSATVDYEGLLSIYKEFGRDEGPPKSTDADGDGIDDQLDQCPNEPEDKDGFQDEDGCPDTDNDADGVPDVSDKCPTDAEDKDGFEDDDGCPDADNDADGVPDTNDKCPNEAEDKDGFEDEDGCPDADNDNDGVADANDKCPNEAETKNGYQDDDGCPDEIPAKVRQFTGVIQGINFKVSSADLLPSSKKTLNKAVAVLKEFPDLKMEIQGHTDDQPMRRKGQFEDNTALSQARAESVKEYFVKQGIEESRLSAKGFGSTAPVIDPTGLKGGKLNAVRAKNRRVEFQLISTLTEGAASQPSEGTPPQQPPAP